MARACHGILALAILVPATLAAQPVISAKSGMVTYVEGRVFLDDVPLARGSQISSFPEMKPGGVLRTEVGRVEVLLPPGYLLRMGDDSSFRMLNNQLVDTRVEMLTGSAIVDVTGANKDDSVAVTLQSGVTTLSKAGSYRFDCQPPRLKVLLGAASVRSGDQTLTVAAGYRLRLDSAAPVPDKFAPTEIDDLDTWSQFRSANRNGLFDGLPAGRVRPTVSTNGSGTAILTTLRDLISQAYGVPESHILNAPSWSTTLYKSPVAPASPPEQDTVGTVVTLAQVQTMLSVRFGLTFHREKKEAPYNALVVARGGARLMPAGSASESQGRWTERRLIAKRFSLRSFATLLSSRMEPPIEDQTGLQGEYDFTVDFLPEVVLPGSVNGLGAHFLAAMEEQLGLRLQQGRRVQEFLVIDHVIRPVPPTPNGGPRSVLSWGQEPLSNMIAFAYSVQPDQVLKCPGWARTNRYAVTLELRGWNEASKSSSDPMRHAAQSWLAENAGLAVHLESRPAPVYALVVSKGGAKLTPSNAPSGPQISLDGGSLICQKVTMDQLVERVLHSRLSLKVENRTGLTGEYDFILPDAPLSHRAPRGAFPFVPPSPLLKSMRDSLGLQLQVVKGTREVVVVDHIHSPAEKLVR